MKKIISLAMMAFAAVAAVSCGEDDKPTTANGIVLKVDKDVIKCDGSDVATFTVVTDEGEVVKDGVKFYSGMEEVDIEGFRFSTTKAGEHSFWASYKTFNSNSVLIKAINTVAPEVATDPKPGSTSFVRRVFLVQFTGTGCGYCPGMTNWLNTLRNDLGMKSKTVLAAVHSEMASGDPAYISAPVSGSEPFRNGNGVPYLSLDMCMGTGYANDNSELHYAGLLKDAIEERMQDAPATAGISVNPRYEENIENGSSGVLARVSVKSSEAAEYKVGAWLVENDLYGKQSIYNQYVTVVQGYDYNTHNHCVRVADSYSSSSYIGYELGQIQAGKTAEKTFVLKTSSKWKLENMRLVVFVAKKDKNGAYSINNVVECPVDKPTPFEYAN
jgi:hypothetical protein